MPVGVAAVRRAARMRRAVAGRARICTQACSRSRTCAPAANRARSGSVSCSLRSGSTSTCWGQCAPPTASATVVGRGAPASAVVMVAAGQAARTAAGTAPGGMVPGTHTRSVRTRPVHVYSHATCGVPYRRRRHTDGVSTPTMVAQNARPTPG